MKRVTSISGCKSKKEFVLLSENAQRQRLKYLVAKKIAIRRTIKPPACTEGFVSFAKQTLSADRYAGLQIRWTNNRQRRLGHDQFDPEGIPGPEIRRRVRLAQCVHTGLGWAVRFRRPLLMKRVTTEGGGCVFTPPLRRPPPPVTLWVKPGSSNRTHDPWSIFGQTAYANP